MLIVLVLKSKSKAKKVGVGWVEFRRAKEEDLGKKDKGIGESVKFTWRARR